MKTRLIIAAAAALGMSAAFAHGSLKKADTDGDGFISLEEMKALHNARIEEHFARVDTDGDGLISEDEHRAEHQAKRERHKEQHKHMKRRHDPERIVEHLDTDGNGSVSLAEFQGRRFADDAEGFNAADADGNGELDPTELAAMMKSHHDQRRAHRDRPDQADRPDRN